MNDTFGRVIEIGGESLVVGNLPTEERWDHVRELIARDFIHGLMDLLRLDEWLLGTASLSLCHDVDLTLLAVYRQIQVEPLVGHWSMQWGFRGWEVEGWPGWDLFYAGCSPTRYLDAESAKMESVKSRPVDFLGHAASWSLSCYVIEEYDKQKNSMEEDYATYLLCCSMWAFCYGHLTEARIKSLDLVADLLKRGGNPNFYFRDFSATIWGYFIRMGPWGCNDVLEKLVMTTKTFVENGADIHMTVLSDKYIWWSSPEGQIPAAGKNPSVILSRKMSILRYLQAHPLQSDVVEVLRAKGGQNYSNYIRISTSLQTNGLSKKQNDKWLAALNTGQIECTHNFESVKKWWRFADQFRKYYEGNPVEDEDFDIQIDWEGDDDQDIDFESLRIFEFMKFQTKPDPEECQPIDG